MCDWLYHQVLWSRTPWGEGTQSLKGHLLTRHVNVWLSTSPSTTTVHILRRASPFHMTDQHAALPDSSVAVSEVVYEVTAGSELCVYPVCHTVYALWPWIKLRETEDWTKHSSAVSFFSFLSLWPKCWARPNVEISIMAISITLQATILYISSEWWGRLRYELGVKNKGANNIWTGYGRQNCRLHYSMKLILTCRFTQYLCLGVRHLKITFDCALLSPSIQC